MMLLSLTITCPACGSRVASDARSCPHCTGMARSWTGPALRPLLLPGTTGFSDDLLERSRRERKLVSATIVMSVLLATLLIAGRIADDKRDQHRVLASQIGAIAAPESGAVVWATLRPLPAPERAQAPLPRSLTRMNRAAPTTSNATLAQATAPEPVATPEPSTEPTSARATTVPSSAPKPIAPQFVPLQPAPAPATSYASRDEIAASPIAPLAAIAATGEAPQRAVASRVVQAPAVRSDAMFAAASGRLDDNEVRSAVTHFVAALPARSAINGDLMAFYGNGAEHRVAIVDEPETVSGAPASVRVVFDIRLSKYDAIGRRQTRILPVSMIVAKRDGDVTASAVTFGTLRRP
jgi:hypothetical protein